MSVHSPLGATSHSASVELTGPPSIGVRTARRGWQGPIALSGLLAFGCLIALAGAHTTPLLPESVRPAQPVGLAGTFDALGLNIHAGGAMAALMLMAGSYVVVVLWSRQLSGRVVLGAIAALYAVILFAPPLISTDIFSYQAYSRMGAVYGVNPYLNGPHAIALDPTNLAQYIGAKWSYIPSVYGPVFTALSYILAPLSIVASVVAYKFVAALSALAIVAMVWNLARRRGVDPVRAAALVGLNPLLALYGVGGGHNDLLMLVPVVGAIYATEVGRERLSGGLAILGIGIKLTAGLVLPFAIASGGPMRDPRRRRDLVTATALGGVLLAGFGVAVFGPGVFSMFAAVQRSQSLGDWHSLSGLIVTLGASTVGHIFGYLFTVAFLVVTALLLRLVWRGQMDWIEGAGWATFAMLITANSLLPWYVAWLLPLVALSTNRRLLRWTLILTCLVQITQLPSYVPHGASLIGY